MAKQQGVSVYNMSADEDEAAVQDATAVAEALVASMPCGGNVDYEDMGPFLVRRLRIGNNVGNVPCPNVCHADGQAAAKPWVQGCIGDGRSERHLCCLTAGVLGVLPPVRI
eukprot:TRINITY_DN36530_c0_g2_i2.p1 TRINITY_DN36530_c0_g2~~TRINITY_DN36530_c0_g2_i2.p1  ORF type:complete len:130 (+),score=25.76 TRINITY_DN36530_c0_g2_i2:60-392(+)